MTCHRLNKKGRNEYNAILQKNCTHDRLKLNVSNFGRKYSYITGTGGNGLSSRKNKHFSSFCSGYDSRVSSRIKGDLSKLWVFDYLNSWKTVTEY